MKNRPVRAAMAAAKAILTALLAVSFAFACLLTTAEAQERPRRTLLDMLFGSSEPDIPEQQPAPRRTIRPHKRVAPPPRQVVVAQPETPPEIPKLPDAKTILVVGDFLAGGHGDGLGDAFSTSPGVVVQTRSIVASGLVR